MQNIQDNQTNSKPAFEVQKIYVKEIMCKVPQAPGFFAAEEFKQGKWEPTFSIEIHVKHQIVNDNTHEVALHATISAKTKENTTAFMLEVQQAGIFAFNGLEKNQVMEIIKNNCPAILYPYLSQTVSNASVQAGFPALMMPMPNAGERDSQESQKSQQAHSDTTDTTDTYHTAEIVQ